MRRNLDRRVETLVPIKNLTVHKRIFGRIMIANLENQSRAWHIGPDGSYRCQPRRAKTFGSHTCFMANPSFAGRGLALNREQIRFPGWSAEKPDGHGPA